MPEGTSTETILPNLFIILIYSSYGGLGSPLIPEPNKQSIKISVFFSKLDNSLISLTFSITRLYFSFAIVELGFEI